jgi:hypothetical protein
MKWLVGFLAAIGAAAVGLFFWRRNPRAVSSAWTQASDTSSALAKSAADKVSEVTDNAASAASAAADEAKGAVAD